MEAKAYQEKENVIKKIRKILPELSELGIKRIGLFGSVKRGDNSIYSDIDVLIEFHKGKKNYNDLLNIRDLLQKTLEKRIDLVQIDGLSKYIGSKILEVVEFIEDRN